MNAPITTHLRETHGPVPGRAGRRHRRPLEARTHWDPWLPADEACPEVPMPLRAAATIVFVVAAVAAVAALLVLVIP